MERASERENSFCWENIKVKFNREKVSIYKDSQFIVWEFDFLLKIEV